MELALAFMARREQALQSRLIARASRGERAPSRGAVGADPGRHRLHLPRPGPDDLHQLAGGRPGRAAAATQGTDIMNAHGTPNVAVVSGIVRDPPLRRRRAAIYLHGDDGHTYYYAHLSQIVGPDRRVAQGEVIGRTGSTGNATTPHTHFEFHPNGGRAVNSYALLRAHC